MSFIDRFFHCVLYSECPLSEVLLQKAITEWIDYYVYSLCGL